MVTITEVAKRAKVSNSAVSVALGGPHSRSGTRVGQTTRRRIQAIAREMGYRPNALATGLRGGRTQVIGLLWSLNGPHQAGPITHDLAIRLQQRGYLLQIADPLSIKTDTAERLLDEFLGRRMDGIVVERNSSKMERTSILQQLEQFPAALMVGNIPPSEGLAMDYLHLDRLPAFREAAEHFAQSGRRRVAILMETIDDKAMAFFHRLGQLGVEVSPDAHIALEPYSGLSLIEWGRQALENRFAGREFPFDALMCINNEWAMVAIDFLRRRGLRVPEDVAVAGFNDVPSNAYQNPPLASGDRRDAAVARTIEQMLFHRLKDPKLPPQRRYIPMRFVWRESAGGGQAFICSHDPSSHRSAESTQGACHASEERFHPGGIAGRAGDHQRSGGDPAAGAE